jgi:hypothetical protein
MGIKIHNNLPSGLKRKGNFKVLKINQKVISYRTVFILYKSFLVTMRDGSVVIPVSFDMIEKYIRWSLDCYLN